MSQLSFVPVLRRDDAGGVPDRKNPDYRDQTTGWLLLW